MGNGYDDFDFDEDQNDGQESNPVRQLRRQLKEKEKREKELLEELTKFRTQSRVSSLSELLSAKGVTPKAAKFYPTDLEVNEENLAKWLAEDGDIFAPAAPPQEEQPAAEEQTQGTQEEQAPPPPWLDTFQRIQGHEAAGEILAPKSNTETLQQLQSAAANAKSSKDFIAALNSGQLG